MANNWDQHVTEQWALPLLPEYFAEHGAGWADSGAIRLSTTPEGYCQLPRTTVRRAMVLGPDRYADPDSSVGGAGALVRDERGYPTDDEIPAEALAVSEGRTELELAEMRRGGRELAQELKDWRKLGPVPS